MFTHVFNLVFPLFDFFFRKQRIWFLEFTSFNFTLKVLNSRRVLINFIKFLFINSIHSYLSESEEILLNFANFVLFT